MSSLLKTLKEDIVNAVKSSNVIKRNVLKVVVGEAEMAALRQNKTVTDEMIINTIKKVTEGNTVTIKLSPNNKQLMYENIVLSAYLPKVLSLDETVGHLLSIKNELTTEKNIGKATGLAMKTLKALNLVVDSKTVIEAINAIRGTNAQIST